MRLLRPYLVLFFLLVASPSEASHIVGGDFTYVFLGRSGGNLRYELTLTLYVDCLNGQPEAIRQDNPAFVAFFDQRSGARALVDTNLQFKIQATVPLNFSNACITNIPQVCLARKVFVDTYEVAPNSAGYIVSYQRCCRNGQIMNIASPGDQGATYFCTIPPLSVAANSSAVFRNYPPQVICRNNPLNYDHSAVDPDGDSLSYEFCAALLGASSSDIKPIPTFPNFNDTVIYLSGYSRARPLVAFPPIQINPTTGLITGTPTQMGRFLVTVCCSEWRGGRLINTSRREFQFVVTDCSKRVVACMPQYSTDVNTYIVECEDFDVQFDNCSAGGFAYHWDFGVPGREDDTSNLISPVFTYPDTGVYVVQLIVNPNSTCSDSISRFVKVYPKFRADFADTGIYCPGSPISFRDSTTSTMRPITSWNWTFGDGTSSTEQFPQHTYPAGGTYNVMLISRNIRNCVDTVLKQLIIDNFDPFAGRDTIIVKGESIQFQASGGAEFRWSPANNLTNPNISNPVGFYPDTGVFVYTLYVQSAYGCVGYDTIRVWVVNEAYFVLPTAFTPNGDGKSDLFRPITAGYSTVKYFRIYNRWGELVYDGNTITEGWNGSYKNSPAEIGTYFWHLAFVDRGGKERHMKGDVTLIR